MIDDEISVWKGVGKRRDLQICLPPDLQLAARALATKVFPVPGGPWKRTPRGGVTLNRWKTSGYKRGRRVISFNECMSKDKRLAL